jgi:CRISPR type III-A/MTUBE-associated protein Csm6
MATLISFVGDSDPLRNDHDGPLLHLARCLKPQKMVLIHSQRSVQKNDRVCQALRSIAGYEPEIEINKEIISNDNVYIFDKMFDILYRIIKNYRENEDIILNLTSGTPQMISAMFSVNRLSDLNVHAYQVATPVHSSNEGIKHDNQKDFKKLLQQNADNVPHFEKRIIEDQGEKFQNILARRSVKELILHNDYLAAYRLILQYHPLGKGSQKKLNNSLTNLSDAIRYQNFIEEVTEADLPDNVKVLLNAYLIIAMQTRRELTSEVLIRVKNFAEACAKYYIDQKHPGLIILRKNLPYLNERNCPDGLIDFINQDSNQTKKFFEFNDYLSLPLYVKIISFYNAKDEVLVSLNEINKVNGIRNQVAHGLKPISKKAVKINLLSQSCFRLLKLIFGVETKWSNFFDHKNDELVKSLL